MSIIYIEDIWASDVFKWFCEHVEDSGGDGCGWIVCENYKECAQWFSEWHESTKGVKNILSWFKREEDNNSISYNFGEEFYVFTNEIPKGETYHDYVFVIQKECFFGFEKHNPLKKLIPIKKEKMKKVITFRDKDGKEISLYFNCDCHDEGFVPICNIEEKTCEEVKDKRVCDLCNAEMIWKDE